MEQCSNFSRDATSWELHFQEIEIKSAELQQRGNITVKTLLFCLIVKGFIKCSYHWDMLTMVLQQEKALLLAVLRARAAEHCIFQHGMPAGIASHQAHPGAPAGAKTKKLLNTDPTTKPCSNAQCPMDNHCSTIAIAQAEPNMRTPWAREHLLRPPQHREPVSSAASRDTRQPPALTLLPMWWQPHGCNSNRCNCSNRWHSNCSRMRPQCLLPHTSCTCGSRVPSDHSQWERMPAILQQDSTLDLPSPTLQPWSNSMNML